MRTQQIRKTGFTLIELLVVIAIIAILAAILFPVFAKARDRAQQTTCINNLKQFSTAFQTYYNDYDETFPKQSGVAKWGDGQGWSEMVYPQIKNFDVYRCPSDPKSLVSYSMNAACSNPGPNAPAYAAIRLSRVKNPAKMIQLMEAPGTGNKAFKLREHAYPPLANGVDQWGDSDLTSEYGTDNQIDGKVYGTNQGGLDTVPHTDAMNIEKVRSASAGHIGRLYFPGRHNGGNDILFLDGHVSSFRAWKPESMTFRFDVQ